MLGIFHSLLLLFFKPHQLTFMILTFGLIDSLPSLIPSNNRCYKQKRAASSCYPFSHLLFVWHFPFVVSGAPSKVPSFHIASFSKVTISSNLYTHQLKGLFAFWMCRTSTFQSWMVHTERTGIFKVLFIWYSVYIIQQLPFEKRPESNFNNISCEKVIQSLGEGENSVICVI